MLLAHFEASRALLVYKSRWEIEKRFKFCCVIKLIRRVSVPSLQFYIKYLFNYSREYIFVIYQLN